MTSSSVDLTAMETAKEVAESAIDPDGDVVLVLEGAELQVSSKVLSVASAVFKAMFGPHFVEGSDLNGAGPRRVPLPEDDAGAMTILCNMLHHRSENVPTEPAPSDLEKLAVVCDKYDCTRVFAPWVRNWATYYQQTASKVVGINRLVHPFYVFDDEILFRQITVLVVTHTVGFISTPRTIGSLPAHVFGTLQPA